MMKRKRLTTSHVKIVDVPFTRWAPDAVISRVVSPQLPIFFRLFGGSIFPIGSMVMVYLPT